MSAVATLLETGRWWQRHTVRVIVFNGSGNGEAIIAKRFWSLRRAEEALDEWADRVAEVVAR